MRTQAQIRDTKMLNRLAVSAERQFERFHLMHEVESDIHSLRQHYLELLG